MLTLDHMVDQNNFPMSSNQFGYSDLSYHPLQAENENFQSYYDWNYSRNGDNNGHFFQPSNGES
jgi:hypothetical protein